MAKKGRDKNYVSFWFWMFAFLVLALPCMLYAMDLTVLNLAIPALSAALAPTAPVSASKISRSCSRCSPWAPMVVDTTGVPMARDSAIFKRVPPPIRSGTIDTADPHR